MRDVCSKVAAKKLQFLGGAIGFAALAVAAAGCLSGQPAPAESEVQVARSPIVTIYGDQKYLAECQANHVPSPPAWGPNSLGSWSDLGLSGTSLNGQSSGRVYRWTKPSGSDAGVCILLNRGNPSGGGQLDIICQSYYGTACFYEGLWTTSAYPTTQTFPNATTKAGADIGAVRCTDCHAGENAFITHNGTHDALDQSGSFMWMPSAWYQPIYAAANTQNPGPETFDGYTVTSGPTGTPGNNTPCLSCHVAGGTGGRFPALGTQKFGVSSNYCTILRTAANRPGSQGGMPPFNTCTPDTDCAAQKDPFTIAMINHCGAGVTPPPAVRINTGDNAGLGTFSGDQYYTGGAQKTRVNNTPPIYVDVTGFPDPAPLNAYLTQRYGSPFTYSIPGFVPGSSHKVRLHFAETNSANNAVGKRVFSVTINGYPQISNLDLYATVGMNKAYIFDCTINADANGKFIMNFTHTHDSATISAIEVL
jgi:mono/diheme cytochrome c family protein